MEEPADDRLEPLVGEWSVEAVFPATGPSDLQGRTVFEWMPGRRFLVQRTAITGPVPDSVAIIGFDRGRGTYLQHYFDSRGVARIYEMSFAAGVWKLSRTAPDFSPLAFAQRFEGTFSDDGRTISGRWETSRDGAAWELDFELLYSRSE